MSLINIVENKTLAIVEQEIPSENKKIYVFNATGIPKDRINCHERFVNKEKKIYLDICGETYLNEFGYGYENKLNAEVYIDHNYYNAYKVTKRDGLVIVELFEKLNERPKLKSVQVEN